MAESSLGHGHSDNICSYRHLSIPQNIHLHAANLRNGTSAKYYTHYAIPQSINTLVCPHAACRIMYVYNIRVEGVMLHVAVTRVRQTAMGCAKTNRFLRGTPCIHVLSAYSSTLYVSVAALDACHPSVHVSHAPWSPRWSWVQSSSVWRHFHKYTMRDCNKCIERPRRNKY